MINKLEQENDYLDLGGIFRPVYLEVLFPIHFNLIAIDAKSSGEFNSLISSNRFSKNTDIQVELTDLSNGDFLGSFSTAIESDTIRLSYFFDQIESWNPETPKLYQAKFLLKKEDKILYEKTEKIGLRTV